MAKDVLIVRFNKNVSMEDWNSICNYISLQLGEEYHVIGLLKGIEVECVTDNDRVLNIDGDNYSYKSLKEAIQANKTKEILTETNVDTKETNTEESNAEDKKKEKS